MKKLITLLFISLSVLTANSASTFLIYRSTTGAKWTNTTGITNPVLVNLSTINSGSEASLNAWIADRSLVSPTMGGGYQFDTGDQVWIISGTYLLTDSVKVYPGTKIYGGFVGTESALTARVKGTNAWEYTNETVLDGNAAAVGVVGGSATLATIIEGITISNCKNSTVTTSGAGARIDGAQTTVQNCIIKNCVTEATTATSAGGIVLTGGAIIKDSYIHDNQTGGYGAGVTIAGDNCKLTGSKITNNTSALFGGGVNLYSTTSGVVVSNCDISNNITTAKSAGGLLVFSTTVTNANPITISNCTFSSNSAAGASGSAGALYLNTNAANTVNVSNCAFTSNTASATKSTSNGGGAIWIAAGTHNIDSCRFTKNAVTSSHGGAILVASASAVATISNSIFTGNTSANHGSAMMLTYSAKVNNCLFYGNIGGNVIYVGTASGTFGTFNNCTVASNKNSADNPAGIYLSTPSIQNAKFTNCLFYNSGVKPIAVDPVPGSDVVLPDVTYCGFDQDLSATWTGSGNIFTVTAAAFVNATNNDYHLAAGSVAIDAGMFTSDYTTDLDGFTRDANFDLGAYEYNPAYVPNAVSNVENFFKCYTNGNNLIVKGFNFGKEINVYAITGARIFSQKAYSNSLSVTLQKGIYIVNIGSYNQKVIVR